MASSPTPCCSTAASTASSSSPRSSSSGRSGRGVARAPIFLVLASYGFYFYGTYDAARDEGVPLGAIGWSVLCLGIIFVGSTLDYFIGRVLGRTQDPGKRKALLLVSVVYYLGVLAIFKYFNFAIESVHDLLAPLRRRRLHARTCGSCSRSGSRSSRSRR